MSNTLNRRLHEHPIDVLQFVLDRHAEAAPCALVVLTNTEGGAVRAPGALMAVTACGSACGYLSGGCIDADVILHTQNALRTGQSETLRYGTGSPFLDITLPCGGAIELSVFVNLDIAQIAAAVSALTARQSTQLTFADGVNDFQASYRPKLRIRIAGRSADPVALAHISRSAGIDTLLWSADTDCLTSAAAIDGLTTHRLTTPGALPASDDDNATAFVLMMHDHDWEPALLSQALSGPAFYIGAVGSPKTHAARCALLAEHGLSRPDIARIHGPIGLVPSLRDASMLAISTLAEIVDAFHTVSTATPSPAIGVLNIA